MSAGQWNRRIVLNVNSGWGLVLSIGLVSSCVAATSQHEVFTNAVPFYSSALKDTKGLNLDKATLDNPAAARDLVDKMGAIQESTTEVNDRCPLTLEEAKQTGQGKRVAGCLPHVDGNHPDSYVLIHLLRWATADKAKVEGDHWYLYRDVAAGRWSQEDFTSAKRLLGVKRCYVLLVQLNARNLVTESGNSYTVGYTPNYDFTISKKTPANIAHLYALLHTYTGGANAGQAKAPSVKGLIKPDAVWGGGVLNLQYRPSDILIKSTFRMKVDDPDQKLADDITFDNEGSYYWDVGFAIPVRKISEIRLDTTSGTATPAKVNSENVFAVLDGYFRPVDVKGSVFNAIPHPIAGLAFAKQPLHKILIGGAWGPQSSELYLGAMFVKQPELSGNSSCSNPSGTSLTGKSHYCAQFTIGINLSVSAIASKLGAPK